MRANALFLQPGIICRAFPKVRGNFVTGKCNGIFCGQFSTIRKVEASGSNNAIIYSLDASHQRHFMSTNAASTPGVASETNLSIFDRVLSQGIHGRYAVALYKSAQSANVVDTVFSDLLSLGEMIKTSSDFERFIAVPGVKPEVRQQVVKDLSAKLKLDKRTENLLLSMIENNRLGNLPKVIDAYDKVYRHFKNEIKCFVQSAKQLSSGEQKEVLTALQNRVGPKSKLIVEFSVSENIMGGLHIKLGEQTLDLTVASRIEQLKNQLSMPLSK